jgi:predicted transcriptional regulator with HTH domain
MLAEQSERLLYIEMYNVHVYMSSDCCLYSKSDNTNKAACIMGMMHRIIG